MGTSAFDKLVQKHSGGASQSAGSAFDALRQKYGSQWGAQDDLDPVYRGPVAAPIRIEAPRGNTLTQGIARLASPLLAAQELREAGEGQGIFDQMRLRLTGQMPQAAPGVTEPEPSVQSASHPALAPADISRASRPSRPSLPSRPGLPSRESAPSRPGLPSRPSPDDVPMVPSSRVPMVRPDNTEAVSGALSIPYNPGRIVDATTTLDKAKDAGTQAVVAVSDLGAKVAQGMFRLGGMVSSPTSFANRAADEIQRYRDAVDSATAPTTRAGELSKPISRVGADLVGWGTLPVSGPAGVLAQGAYSGILGASDRDATPQSVAAMTALGAGWPILADYGASLSAPVQRYVSQTADPIAGVVGARVAPNVGRRGDILAEGSEVLFNPRAPVYGPAIPSPAGPPELTPALATERLSAAAAAAPAQSAGITVPTTFEPRSRQMATWRAKQRAKAAEALAGVIPEDEAIALREAGQAASNRALPVEDVSATGALEAAAQRGQQERSADEGLKLYSIGSAAMDALKHWNDQTAIGRAVRGAALTGTGMVMRDSNDEDARKWGTRLMIGGVAYGSGALSSKFAREVGDGLKMAFAPASRTPESLAMANIFRANSGNSRRFIAQSAEDTQKFSEWLTQRWAAGSRVALMEDIERGSSFAAGRLANGVGGIRTMLDETRDAIRALGTGKLETFYNDYFPHIWYDPNDPSGAAIGQKFAQMQSKRQMGGQASFLKGRHIEYTLDGMFPQGVPANLRKMSDEELLAEVKRQDGLMPISTNPVEMALVKLREMQKYLSDVRSLQDAHAQGLLHLANDANPAPDGWMQIRTPLGTVTGPRNPVTKQALVTGTYYAPEPVARVINNYLSPGLRGNKAFDVWRTVGNDLNKLQLGLSAFHLGMTSVDAIVSQNALALEKLATGDVAGALKSAATSPAAPVTNYLRGKEVAKAYLSKAPMGKGLDGLARAVADAGGAIKMDGFYEGSAPHGIIEAWKKGNKGTAMYNFVTLPFEVVTKPMMEHIVPMQKLGVFADLAEFELGRLPASATDAERRAVLAKVWDSVDNRMGQLVYDNVFWHRVFKDLAMSSVRSVGWNTGTMRELGGAATDVITGQGLTHRVAYAAALPMTVMSIGMLGAVQHYLATGESPQGIKDYFYPRTGTYDSAGNPNRVQLPSYVRDVRDYWTDTPKTLSHKVHPLLQMLGDYFTNADYHGNQIYDEDADPFTLGAQIGKHLVTNALPFGISNAVEQRKRGAGLGTQALGFVGVTAAPRDVVRSPAQALMVKLLPKGAGGLSPEEAADQQARREALSSLRGEPGVDVDAVNRALERGALVPKQLERLMRRANIDPTVEMFERLPLREALRVFALADDRERGLWAPALTRKTAAARNAGLSIPIP